MLVIKPILLNFLNSDILKINSLVTDINSTI